MTTSEIAELHLTSAAIDIYGEPFSNSSDAAIEWVQWGGAIHFPTQRAAGLAQVTTTIQALMPAFDGIKAGITLVLLCRGGEAIIFRCSWTIEEGYSCRTSQNDTLYGEEAEEYINRYFTTEGERQRLIPPAGRIHPDKISLRDEAPLTVLAPD